MCSQSNLDIYYYVISKNWKCLLLRFETYSALYWINLSFLLLWIINPFWSTLKESLFILSQSFSMTRFPFISDSSLNIIFHKIKSVISEVIADLKLILVIFRGHFWVNVIKTYKLFPIWNVIYKKFQRFLLSYFLLFSIIYCDQ